MPRKKTLTAWTAEILPLLGTMPDAKLGKHVGRSAQAVGALRRRLGIKTFSEGRHSWGETELGPIRLPIAFIAIAFFSAIAPAQTGTPAKPTITVLPKADLDVVTCIEITQDPRHPPGGSIGRCD
jgi:hypothetical protein